MHSVVIIDDEALARQLIGQLLIGYPEFQVVAEAADGLEGFKAIQQYAPDLIFLDVQMPKVNGFEMLELLEERPAVIFTTAFDEYALGAFEAHAIDYLLKPVTKERFDKALQKWLATVGRQQQLQQFLQERPRTEYQNRMVVKEAGHIRIVAASEIHYIEASDDYIRIHTAGGHHLKKSTLAQAEQALDPKQFVRVHRSYLLPVQQLLRLEPYEKESHIALLHCGAKIPVSKSGMARLKAILGW